MLDSYVSRIVAIPRPSAACRPIEKYLNRSVLASTKLRLVSFPICIFTADTMHCRQRKAQRL